MPDIELTTKQAAEELGVADRTVRRWLKQGKLTGRKVVRGNLGEAWRISAASVRRKAADSAHGQQPAAIAQGQPTDAVTVGQIQVLVNEVRSLREENAAYREHLERLTIEFERLRTSVQRLLPAPKDEKPRPWYKRLWQRKGGD